MSGDLFSASKFRWLEQIARDAELRHSAVRVAVILSSYQSREHGHAWPSVARLGEETGLSRRAVQLALDQLATRGHLERQIGGGRAATSRYQMRLKAEKQRTSVHGKADKGRMDVHPNGQKQRTSVHPSAAETVHEYAQNGAQACTRIPLKNPIEGTLSQHFTEFWNHYPRKAGKKAAERAFAKAVKEGASPADLIAGAMRYAAEREGQDPRFTKHPATWLNGGCWEDEPTPGGMQKRQDRRLSAAEFAQRRNEAIEHGDWE